MKSVYEIRRENLRTLQNERGGPTSLSKKLGHANGSYVAQLIGPRPSREISEKVARESEKKLNLPIGWLDTEQNPKGRPVVVDAITLGACVTAVATALRDTGITPDPETYGTLVGLAYEHAQLAGQVDEPFLLKLVKLTQRP